jgi:CRP-like cAMP-binding protein
MLPEDIIDICENYAVRRLYSDGEQIQARGDRKPGLSIIRSGAVKVGNYGRDGQYFLTRILTVGETFGEFTLFADLPRTHNAEACGDTAIDEIAKPAFQTLVRERPEIKDYLLISLAENLHTALEILDDIRRQPIIVRVAKLLLSYLGNAKNSLNIPLTQTVIAESLGVTRLSVHNSLKSLEAQGMLIRKYGRININDLSVLKAWIADHEELANLER